LSRSETNCLCGAVKIIADSINPKFTVCHCQSCRTWGGAPFFAVKCGINVEIEGEEHVTVYQSSDWASRGFCIKCGTHLFYKFNESGEYNLPVGLFSELEGLEMQMQYFTDKRPSYYCFENSTKEMTTAEIMALYSPTL
jgi:hypothetical protein